MAKVVILDPSLEGELSHHFYACSALIHELTEAGLAWALVAHADAAPAVLRLRALRHFRLSGYYHVPGAPPEQDMESTALANAIMLNDLLGLDRADLAAEDLIFFPAVTANMVLGVAQWIATFPPARAPHFGLCLMFQPDWHPAGRSSEVGPVFYRQAFPFIPAALRPRVRYTCETEGLAREYAPWVGVEPRVAPIPTIQHLIAGDDGRAPQERPLAFLGYAKAEKGFHLLPDIVAGVLRHRPRTRFLVQLMGHDEALVGRVREALQAHGPAVEFVEGPVAAPRMVDLMRQSGLILMPYDPTTYRTRGSAIFTEARSLGVPVVLPADTAAAELGVAGGFAEAFDTFDAAAVVRSTLRALARIEALTAAARREARRLRQEAPGYLRPFLEVAGLVAPAAAREREEVPA